MTETKLREDQSRTLANSMPIIVWTANPDGALDYYNDRWYEYTGMERGGTGDQSWEPVLHPDDLQMCLDIWYASVRSGSAYEIEYRFKKQSTGEYRWHLGRATPVRDESGAIIKWHGTGTDIHDLKVAQQELEAREAQLNTIIETVPVGLVLAELPTGRIVSGNKYVEQMLRHPVFYSPDIDSYDEWISFHADGTRVSGHEYPLARMMLAGEENPSIDVNYQRGDGTMAWTRMTGRPVRDRFGRVTGGVVALIDIDEQQKNQAALAEALQSKDLLLYEINHRVKNSLQLVNSVLALEAAKIDQPDARAALMAARKKIDVLARLHQRLYSSGTHDQIDLKVSVEELAQVLLTSAGRDDVAFRAEYSGDPMIHIGKASPLMLALTELLTNCLKYGLGAEMPELSIVVVNTSGELALTIQDNGPGLPATTEGISGSLGMQIVAALLGQLRGTIENNAGEPGARFVLRIPSMLVNPEKSEFQ